EPPSRRARLATGPRDERARGGDDGAMAIGTLERGELARERTVIGAHVEAVASVLGPAQLDRAGERLEVERTQRVDRGHGLPVARVEARSGQLRLDEAV